MWTMNRVSSSVVSIYIGARVMILYFGKNSQFNSFLFRKNVLDGHYIYGQPKNDTPMTDRVYGQIS